ncbi:MAG: hypothetical protein M1814_000285 [Vezdaea aestivalis]|nr:MAG: hypothetical protein M1814_000285 [Vezdaea aestivalis]
MARTLVIGATRGLGASLVRHYDASKHQVWGTSRSSSAPSGFPSGISWIGGVDVGEEYAGLTIAKALDKPPLDNVIITAGYFATESFDKPNFQDEVQMYKTSSIGPVFIVHHLEKAGLLKKGSKIILVSSESGSITLRHPKEGGGNFAHHASKTALNMVGKLLSLDLADKEIAIGILHPGFMRTEMTKGVGFDKYWDDGGAVTPDVAASSLIEFINDFGMDKTGQYWAPRGPKDIGTAESVLGSDLPTPLQLPW